MFNVLQNSTKKDEEYMLCFNGNISLLLRVTWLNLLLSTCATYAVVMFVRRLSLHVYPSITFTRLLHVIKPVHYY